jgi:hypothetical protein
VNTGSNTIIVQTDTERNLVLIANFYDSQNNLIETNGALIDANTLSPSDSSAFSVLVGIDPNDILKLKQT